MTRLPFILACDYFFNVIWPRVQVAAAVAFVAAIVIGGVR